VPHPDRGSGPAFPTKHSFAAARAFVGKQGVRLRSTTGKEVTATQAWTQHGDTPTIAFQAAQVHASACIACWGYPLSCTGAPIGEFAQALDRMIGAGSA
jgi:hypothetical protein